MLELQPAPGTAVDLLTNCWCVHAAGVMQSLVDKVDDPTAKEKKVAALVTDSPTAMQRAKELLVQKPGYEHIIHIRYAQELKRYPMIIVCWQ